MKRYDFEPEELDLLLAGVREPGLSRKRNLRILKRVEETTGVNASGRAVTRLTRRAWLVLALLTALAVCLGIGTYAYAEAAEYCRALEYFEENGISTEGLTRAEIKAVYRSFLIESTEQDGGTGEVKHTADVTEVAGIGFPSETYKPSEDELNDGEERHREGLASRSSGYIAWTETEEGILVTGYGSDGRELWSSAVKGMDYWWTENVEDGVILVGAELGTGAPMVGKYSIEGGYLWTCVLERGEIQSVIGNADGGITVFATVKDCEHDRDHAVIVSRIGPEGETVYSAENPTEDPIRVCEPVHFGESYAAIGYNDSIKRFDEESIILIDGEGRITRQFTVGADGERYDFLALAVYGGKLYVSAAVSRYELIDPLYGPEAGRVPDDKYLETIKSAFSALLLVYDDPESSPAVFYEVYGASCYGIRVNGDGMLEWDVRSIISAEYDRRYKQNVSRFINARVKLYKYVFSADGGFAEKIDTGEITAY